MQYYTRLIHMINSWYENYTKLSWRKVTYYLIKDIKINVFNVFVAKISRMYSIWIGENMRFTNNARSLVIILLAHKTNIKHEL